MGKKRKLAELNSQVEEAASSVGDKFRESREEWAGFAKQTGEDLDRNKRLECLKKLKSVLAESKDDLGSIEIDDIFIKELLTTFTASCSEEDRLILEILRMCERTFAYDMRKFSPIVWGELAGNKYDDLRKLGATLYDRPTADQVLELLDGKQVWLSTLHMPLERPSHPTEAAIENGANIYNPAFLLPLFASLLTPETEISCRKFVEQNALAFAFAATSLKDKKLRSFAFLILSRFRDRLRDLTAEDFEEKALFAYLLHVFKNSLDAPNQRVCNVVSHFLARMSKLLLHPEDPVYPSLMAFLVLKPTLDLGNVPEMYKLLLSSSTEHFERERHWLLQLLADGLREPNDYNVIEKRFGFKLILSQFATSLADHRSRALILRLVKAAVHHPSIAVDLCRRANLIGWLVLAVRQPAVTRWEVGFLAEVFVIAARHVASSAVDSLIKSNMIVGCFAMKNALAMIDDGAKKTWLGQVEKLAQQS